MIETFLSQYPATISAISACATAGAVIVALYLARRHSRVRLTVFADIAVYISSGAQTGSPAIDMEDAPRMISVTINNTGPVVVSIPYWSSFAWSVVGSKETAMQIPAEPDFRSEPITLLPGKSASIVLSFDLPAHVTLMKNLAATSRFGAWSLRFPKLTIRTEVGDFFSGEARQIFTLTLLHSLNAEAALEPSPGSSE